MKQGLNVHLYPSDFLHESRIEKIAEVLSSLSIFHAIWLVGIREPHLDPEEAFSEHVRLFRIGRPTMRKSLIAKLTAFIRYYAGTFTLVRGVTTVSPLARGPGWLTWGCSVMVTVRLPCATATRWVDALAPTSTMWAWP